jgi:hypothetical protein
MKLDTPPKGMLRIGDLPAIRQIRAVDLTGAPEYRRLWKGRSPDDGHDLPQPGFASPMGFWLTEASDATPPSADGFTIRFEPHGTPAAPSEAKSQSAAPSRRPEQTVRLKAPLVGDGELVLRISPSGVRITTSDAAWKALSEPVLLAVGQYWRFLVIEEKLDRLTEEAQADVAHATMPSLATLRSRRRLTENARAVRDLLLDLPHFEGTLTDPFPYCTTELAAQTYLALAEKLRLEPWCELIDERTEAIEDTYEAVTEKLLEFKNFAWEALLEILIVVILLGELGLNLWEIFGPE